MRVEVGFSTTSGLASRLVSLATRCPASHCWVRVTEPDRPATVIESVLGYGVCESLWSSWVNRPGVRVLALYRPNMWLTDGVRWVRNHLGNPYGLIQDVMDGLELIAGRHRGIGPGPSLAGVVAARDLLHPPPHPALPPAVSSCWNRSCWNCSQVVDGILANSGFRGSELLNPRTVTPADVWELMRRECVPEVSW